MIEERPVSRYKKGDIVRVVDEPYEDCPFEWIGAMDEFCGKEARIINVTWIDRLKAYGYKIDIDEFGCTWCDNCFTFEPDLEESGIDPSMLFQ